MYNQRVTIDNVLSFKSMPKILSDFKDIAVYRKGGVSHLDMEVQSLGDASVKTQDLEDSRRELIALSGVKWNTCIKNQSHLRPVVKFDGGLKDHK